MTKPVYTAKDGLLWKDGVIVPLPEADVVAAAHGFTCAERMVKALEDEREGLPSASGFERVVFCAGSPAAERACPPEKEETEIARRGTDIHNALFTDDDSALKVTDKIVKDRLRKIEDDAVSAWMAEFEIKPEDVTVLREVRIWIRNRGTLGKVASARVDCAAVCESQGRALIIDAKSGFLDTVPAEINWQLRVQAVALWHEYHFSVNNIRAAISSGRTGSKYDPVDYDTNSLEWAEGQIQFYKRNSDDEFAPRVPGAHCRYCRARGDCPQAGAFAMLPAVVSRSTLADKKTIELKLALMSPQALATINDQAPLITAILDGVKSRLKGMLRDDLAAVGLALVPNAPMRKISNVQLAYDVLKSRGLITDEEFRSVCSLPIGALEDLIVPRLKTKVQFANFKNDALKDEFSDIIAPSITMQPKAPSLKPIKKSK